MKAEFHAGDVLVQIGEFEKWKVLGIEYGGSVYRVQSFWGEKEGYSPNIFPVGLIEKDMVKVGTWDMDKNQEVDDDVQ